MLPSNHRINLHSFILLFVSFLFAVSALFADIEEWKQSLQQAETIINTKSESDAIPIFEKMISEISAERAKRPLTAEERGLLEKGLDHLAEAFYNTNNLAKAKETFLQLMNVSPNYKLDEDLVSPKIVQMFATLKQQSLGSLNLNINPKDASIEIDGQPVMQQEGPVFVVKGDHAIKISKAGFDSFSKKVTVSPGAPTAINVELKKSADPVAALLAGHTELQQAYEQGLASGDKAKIAAALKAAGDLVPAENKADSQKIYELALSNAKETDDKALIGEIETALGASLQSQNNKDGAQAHLENAVAALQNTSDKETLIRASLQLADLLQAKQDSPGAIKYYEAAVPLLKEKGDKKSAAETLYKLGNIKRAQKDPGAQKDYQESLSLFQELNDTDSASKVQMSLEDVQTAQRNKAVDILNEAVALLNQGNDAEAEKKFSEALELAKNSGAKESASSALLSIGYIKNLKGQYAEAKSTYEEALALSRETGSKANQALALYGLAITAFNLQDTQQANALYDQSAALYKELGQQPRPKSW